jgi:hypothetical protein
MERIPKKLLKPPVVVEQLSQEEIDLRKYVQISSLI